MNSLNSIVISKKIYDDSFLKTKAFFASLFIHTTLLAASFYLAATEIVKVPKEESNIVISLSNSIPSSANLKLPEPVVEAPQKTVQKDEKKITKKLQTPPKVLKKQIQHKKHQLITEKQTLQKISPITDVNSSEAFTPHVFSESSNQNPDKKLTYSPLAITSEKPNEVQKPQESSSLINPTSLGQIRAMIQNSLIYPAMARKLKIEGVVVVSFVLLQDGHVESATINTTSGSNSLDTKALHTVLSLSGEYPSLNEKVQLQIPIAFSLKKS